MKSANTTPTPAAQNLLDARNALHVALLRIARMQDRQTTTQHGKE